LARQSETILLKELELERYYLQYWLDAKKDPRFRKNRYFFLQQLASAGGLSSNILLMSELGKNLGTPDNVSPGVLRTSNQIFIASNSTAASASTFELLSNAYTALKNKKQKRDPKTAANEFVRRVKEIDELLASRTMSLQNLPPSNIKAVLDEEGNLLKHLRDWCVSDLTDIYADVKSYQAGNSAFYALDATANWMLMASWIISLRAVDRSSLNGPGIIASLPGDVILAISAPLSSRIGTILSKHNKKKICRMLNEEPREMAAETDVSIKRIEQLTANMDERSLVLCDSLIDRLAITKTWSNRCVEFIQEREDDIRHLNKVAAQQNIAGPILGAMFTEQDAADTFAYYNYSARSSKTVNAVAFSGNIMAGTAAAAGIGLTGWNYISEIKHRRKLLRTNTDPEQLLKGRITTIDQLESNLFSKGKLSR